MKKLCLLILFVFCFGCICTAQEVKFYVGNTVSLGLGRNQNYYRFLPYKSENWSLLPNRKKIVAEYQINAGKLFKPLSTSYSAFFESGLKIGYQSGKITNGMENADYSETYISLPLAFGILKKTNSKILKHTVGVAVYGSVLEETKMKSGNDKKWGFFAQPRGMFFLSTHLLFPSKKSGRYYGVGVEVSKDVGFNYKTTAIPFVIENMRVAITFSPFTDFF